VASHHQPPAIKKVIQILRDGIGGDPEVRREVSTGWPVIVVTPETQTFGVFYEKGFLEDYGSRKNEFDSKLSDLVPQLMAAPTKTVYIDGDANIEAFPNGLVLGHASKAVR
jgi:hypothetical protein